ncbi:MAG: cytochrome c oxidase subunit II [Nitrospirae bacterium]|nr:cytochrome c oxidase subunit II [Nitrospirota bacterium]
MYTTFLDRSANVDNVMFFIVGISVFMLVLVTFLMIFFLVKYNRKKNPVAENIEGNLKLEIIWTVIPTILVLAMFYYGWIGFKIMRNPPRDAMPVKVTARMWSWSFAYENGQKSDELNVPLNRPVKLIIISEDVIHSLFIPAFRIKEDAVPGMETYLWFNPDKIGTYDLFCSEYCGVGHHSMISKVNVMSQGDFSRWYAKKEEAAAPKGRDALAIMKKNACLDCHTTDGTVEIGPSFKGIFGKKEKVITNGREREVVVDEEYLKRSLIEPDADVVKGFDAIMPSQKGALTDEEISVIIEYIKDLK